MMRFYYEILYVDGLCCYVHHMLAVGWIVGTWSSNPSSEGPYEVIGVIFATVAQNQEFRALLTCQNA